MKFKIMENEPIYLAGVVHYGSLEKRGRYKSRGGAHSHFDTRDEAFDNNIDDLKKNAQELRDRIADEMNFHADHFSNDYQEHRRQWKEETEKARAEAGKNQEEIAGSAHRQDGDDRQQRGGDYSANFEGAIKRFGDVMESFGKHMQKNARNWDHNIRNWSENVEKNMEDLGDKMENWGEDFGKRMEEWGESFGEKWDRDFDEAIVAAAIRRYPIFRTYEDVYDKYIADHPNHIKKQTFYEVQIMDTSFEDVASMVMLGSRMDSLQDMRYPVATMTFEPDKWVAVKLTQEEYAKDWLGSLEKVEQLKNYELEPYFILRHKKSGDDSEIRLFCPVREKKDER